jgi:hypothetical protein
MAVTSEVDGTYIPLGARRTFKASDSYAAAGPKVGDLVKRDLSDNGLVARCVANDPPMGRVESINWGNGYLTIDWWIQGLTQELEYAGTLAIGQRVVANGDRGPGGTDRVKYEGVDTAIGVGQVSSIDYPRPGYCVVEIGQR